MLLGLIVEEHGMCMLRYQSIVNESNTIGPVLHGAA